MFNAVNGEKMDEINEAMRRKAVKNEGTYYGKGIC